MIYILEVNMDYKSAHKLIWTFFILGIAGWLITGNLYPSNYGLRFIPIILILVAIFIKIKFYRCPKCGSMLNMSAKAPEKCSVCKERIG
jgi:hypothetical protein